MLAHAGGVRGDGEPFTRDIALASGISDWQLRGPEYHRLFHRVYVPARTPLTPEVLARAALLVAPPGSVAARHTAARLWPGVVPEQPDIHLALRPGARMEAAGVDARVRALAHHDVRGGIPLTSPADTFLDLAEDLGLVDLVVLGDSLVRRGLLEPHALVSAAERARRRRIRTARRAARLLRSGGRLSDGDTAASALGSGSSSGTRGEPHHPG